MQRSFMQLAAAALMIGGHAAAQSGATQSMPTGPAFLGQWELDLARMPADYGPPPKRVLYTFEEAGAGYWRTKIDITAPDGSVRHMAVRYKQDGTMATGEGDRSEADSAAFNSPLPGVLVMSLSKNQHLGSVRVYAVSADGKEMTESAANVKDGGSPFVRNFHYKRVG